MSPAQRQIMLFLPPALVAVPSDLRSVVVISLLSCTDSIYQQARASCSFLQ